jgi:hypothetical protein
VAVSVLVAAGAVVLVSCLCFRRRRTNAANALKHAEEVTGYSETKVDLVETFAEPALPMEPFAEGGTRSEGTGGSLDGSTANNQDAKIAVTTDSIIMMMPGQVDSETETLEEQMPPEKVCLEEQRPPKKVLGELPPIVKALAWTPQSAPPRDVFPPFSQSPRLSHRPRSILDEPLPPIRLERMDDLLPSVHPERLEPEASAVTTPVGSSRGFSERDKGRRHRGNSQGSGTRPRKQSSAADGRSTARDEEAPPPPASRSEVGRGSMWAEAEIF